MIRDQRERYHADQTLILQKLWGRLERSRPGKTIERRGGRKIRRIRKKIREETNHKLREREKKRERWFGLSVWKEGERRERRKVR